MNMDKNNEPNNCLLIIDINSFRISF